MRVHVGKDHGLSFILTSEEIEACFPGANPEDLSLTPNYERGVFYLRQGVINNIGPRHPSLYRPAPKNGKPQRRVLWAGKHLPFSGTLPIFGATEAADVQTIPGVGWSCIVDPREMRRLRHRTPAAKKSMPKPAAAGPTLADLIQAVRMVNELSTEHGLGGELKIVDGRLVVMVS